MCNKKKLLVALDMADGELEGLSSFTIVDKEKRVNRVLRHTLFYY